VLDLERALGESRVETAPERCANYVRDESYIDGIVPFAVVHASNTADIAKTLSICTERGMPVFPRAAGSGKTGGAVPT
uniref:FAD-binding oxidoreductase n=1 Tax=Salmonella sp. SAL4357 TaxID=3159878 RepID=UPI0039789D32